MSSTDDEIFYSAHTYFTHVRLVNIFKGSGISEIPSLKKLVGSDCVLPIHSDLYGSPIDVVGFYMLHPEKIASLRPEVAAKVVADARARGHELPNVTAREGTKRALMDRDPQDVYVHHVILTGHHRSLMVDNTVVSCDREDDTKRRLCEACHELNEKKNLSRHIPFLAHHIRKGLHGYSILPLLNRTAIRTLGEQLESEDVKMLVSQCKALGGRKKDEALPLLQGDQYRR